MKKYLALVLTLVFCLSVPAYAEDLSGDSGDSDSPAYEESGGEISAPDPEPEPTSNPEPALEPEPTPEPEPAPDPEPTPELVPVDPPETPVDPPQELPTPDPTLDIPQEVPGLSDTLPSVLPDLGGFAPDSLYTVQQEPAMSPYSTYSIDGDSPDRTSGTLADITARLFGEYQPRTQTVTDYLSDGTSVTYDQYVPGVAGMDWNWIAGAVLFTIVLWSLFKLLGVFFKNA